MSSKIMARILKRCCQYLENSEIGYDVLAYPPRGWEGASTGEGWGAARIAPEHTLAAALPTSRVAGF